MKHFNYPFGQIFRFCITGIFLILSINLFSQEPLAITKVTGTINLDGVPDEELWKSVPPLPMTMLWPKSGIEPTQKTIAKIAYDDEFIYFSAILYYTKPGMIRAVSKKRDYNDAKCDWVGVMFDSFNDNENAFAFYTNPNGLRMDLAVKNDCVSDLDYNFSWSTFWDVKTKITGDIWSTEFRIPLSSLRFQVEDGKTIMGFLAHRWIPANSEMSTFPSVSQEFNIAYWKASLFTDMLFEGLKPVKPLYITPYATVGLTQVSELNELETSYHMKSTPKFDVGLDVKYSLTNNLTTDLTINTDFAQVEADDQKINLTRFSLFFPEKRVFFQEKADVFDFSFSENNNLFYSRRIGIYDGKPVRIYGGLRLTGRIHDWDIGMMDMQTAPIENNPGENFGVLRTKRRVFNKNSYVGGILTSKLGMNGSYNVAYGLDGLFRVFGDDYLTLKMAQSLENDSSNNILDLSPTRLFLNWQRRNEKGFGYNLFYSYLGEAYNPGIGFESRGNCQVISGTFQYGWLGRKDASMRIQKVSLGGSGILSSTDGSLESGNRSLTWQFTANKGYGGYIMGNWFTEKLTDSLVLGNKQASVPPGKYDFGSLKAQYYTSSGHDVYCIFTGEAGSFYDGWKLSLTSSPSLVIGTDFEIGLTYDLNVVNFHSREMKFINHILSLKGGYTMSTKISMNALVQYNTSINKIMANFRLRYNPKEGNDFYLVYDEGLNTNITHGNPYLSSSSGRTILIKYTYTFLL
jgi:hypothetical protein